MNNCRWLILFLSSGKERLKINDKIGGGKESRTPDLWNANPTLYQLSYTPIETLGCLNE